MRLHLLLTTRFQQQCRSSVFLPKSTQQKLRVAAMPKRNHCLCLQQMSSTPPVHVQVRLAAIMPLSCFNCIEMSQLILAQISQVPESVSLQTSPLVNGMPLTTMRKTRLLSAFSGTDFQWSTKVPSPPHHQEIISRQQSILET